MDTLEERNLNRLRNGKMMLEFSSNRRSHVSTFVLALFAVQLGMHRFYLGHIRFGFAILMTTILLIVLVAIYGQGENSVMMDIVFGVGWLYVLFLLFEIILAPVWTSRENARIKQKLKLKHGVKELSD